MRRLVGIAAVIKDGEIVEHGPTARLINSPQDAYTRALIASVPGRDFSNQRAVAV